MSADDILGPLTEPTPSEVSGLETTQPRSRSTSNSTNPFRRSSPKTPPQRAENTEKSRTTTHTGAISNDSTGKFPTYSEEPTISNSKKSSLASSGRPRRSSSLRERFPGDTSHRPLDQLIHDTKLADRAPHLRKKHIQGADSVDHLDDAVLSSYHHEGPYDAASLARNNSYGNSPLAALDKTNHEALKATPREKIQDSINRHRPLDGVAETPPGQRDRLGRVYHYREGTDLMIEEGGYKRWPGLDYLPEDLKGKGEPSYSIERALKEHQASAKRHSPRPLDSSAEEDGAELELLESRRESQDSALPAEGSASRAIVSSAEQSYSDWEQSKRHSGHSTSARISGEFRRRFGSLRKRDGQAAVGAGTE